MLLETIKLILLLLGTVILTGGTVFLYFWRKSRRAAERRALGLPPVRHRTSPLTWLVSFFLVAGGCVMLFQAADFVAKDKVNAANNAAKYVYRTAEAFVREGASADCVTVIAQFSETDTPLKAWMHREAEQSEICRNENWYAVVFADGRIRYALWSGNPITPADFHAQDPAAERRKVRWGHHYREALGYYANSAPPD